MVDATISMVLSRLAPVIEQRVRDEVCMMINSIDEANKLASKLKIIKDLLDDAEQKGVTDPKVKSWLNKLEDISYEMDDVLDEMEWENTWLQMEGLEVDEPASNPWHKVASFLESVCLCIQRNFERRNINWNIKNMNKRLDGIREQNEQEFNFVPNVGRGYSQDSKLTRESASGVEISQVHGRDDDKEILVSKLLSEGSSRMEPGTPVISIVGVGGLGKTTLAQLLFNDEKVEDHFEVKVWVCVSDPFDQIGVAKAILEDLKKQTPNLSRLQSLLQDIEEAVSGKIFLLVLDDVWTEDRTLWEPIKNSLRKGNPGSRILVTTRNEKVARVMGSNEVQIHRLRQLPDSECWKVFKQIALVGREEEKDLEAIGLEIVGKCNGLPLAAKAMGGLLFFKRSSDEWRRVLESPLWELETARKDIFPYLVLSYNELNPVAKRCFSYCAVFPKDKDMVVLDLIRVWCAQGFFSSDDMELVGRETFDDLAMRSFFQDFERKSDGGEIYSCKMHDIVHDFAQFLTKDESVIGKSIDCGKKSRHFYLVADKDESKATASAIAHGKWCGYEKCRSYFTEGCAIPLDLLKHLKRVRVLVMDRCGLEEIPSEIGSNIHLRYLNLRKNPIQQLPEAICNLYNLQTLLLYGCEKLRSLPEGIHKLKKLRHLIFDDIPIELPQGLGELTNLETLNNICAWRRNWNNLVLLRNLNRLRFLSIIMRDSEDPNEAVRVVERANLKAKNLMEELRLYCNEQVPIQVIEALQPHPDLKLLGFRCTCLPQWFTTLTRLRDLHIAGVCCHWEKKSDDAIKEITSLPALGTLMPFLESLDLVELCDMERLSREFLGISAEHTIAFPRLKTLRFLFCTSWKEWEDISPEEAESKNISVFPSLRTLDISWCPQLKTLPHRLLRKAASLTNFEINHCDQLRADYSHWQESRQQG